MPITYNMNTRNLNEILVDESIFIPAHQRAFIWKLRQQENLVDTIMKGYVMPPLIICEVIVNNKRTRSLEDGQQRYTTLKRFYNNEFTYNKKYFKDYSPNEKAQFEYYKVHITTYENATEDERTEMFLNFQDGTSLTVGNRFHAALKTRLVTYATERFLTPGNPLYQRASAVWGEHLQEKDNKGKNFLTNAMAIAGGLAYGVDHITKSYDILGPILNREFDVAMADKRLDMLLKVYERVPGPNIYISKEKKIHWPVGTLTGYILASLINDPSEEMIGKWVQYILDSRQKAKKYVDLHANKPKTRSWNALRWRIGYENVFVNHVVPGDNENDDDSTIDDE